ncbi:MAG: ABC transporter permease [Phycisphaerales bacterium]
MTERATGTGEPAAISGIEVMRGVGAVRAKGFWADAWERVLRRPGAVAGLVWISVVGFFAVFAPLIANAHPLRVERAGADGQTIVEWPLLAHLTPSDWTLLALALLGLPWVFFGPRSLSRAQRLGMLVVGGLQAGFIVVIAPALVEWARDGARTEWLRVFARGEAGPWAIGGAVALAISAAAAWIPTVDSLRARLASALLVGAGAAAIAASTGGASLVNFEKYIEQEQAGARVTWTLIPWSPQYARSDMSNIAPGSTVAEVERLRQYQGTAFGARRTLLGTDALGGDVLAQMLWACRLSISIGLVSTGIAVLIGVTVGAVMGYFGGWVDLVLFRIVEVFMAVPVLFLLIVAAGVLPRDTYVMMAIIGCFSWTGAARFTRAEFLKLRNQDFVQAAKATGLPLRAILFRHMLPNGVTPVLVDASFAIAAAISIEATLSYLGLGPDGQASWGKLLSSATAATGTFVWWLAVFPGLAIFLSVLSYNLLGEAMRDAIDPKLRKAAH